MGGMTGCAGCVQCLNACMGDATCQTNCYNNTTMNGQLILSDLLDCLDQACPSTNPNDVCAMQTQACSNCYNNAQMGNGACVQMLNDCTMDKP